MDEFIEPRLPASITDNTPLGPALVNLAVVLSDQPATGFATSNIPAQKLIARRRRRDRTLAIG